MNGLQIMSPKDLHGDMNMPHLSEAFLAKPHEMETLLTYHFMKEKDLPLTALTNLLQNSEGIENEVHRWDYEMTGNIRRAILGSPDTLPIEVGKGMSSFRITMEEAAYGYGDLLRLADEEYGEPHQIRVEGDPQRIGNGFVYTVKLATTDPNDFILRDYITGDNGKPATVFRIGQYSEEGSWRGGPISYTTRGKLEHSLHISRKIHRVTGTSAKTKLAVGVPTSSNKRAFYWIEAGAFKLLANLTYERELLKLYGTRLGGMPAQHIVSYGEGGGVLRAGGGLRSQVPKSHKFYYDPRAGLDMDFFDGIFMQLSRSSSRSGGGVKFSVGGGYLFMERFHQAVVKKYGDTFKLVDTKFVRGDGAELSFGSYFRTYQFSNGNEATVYHLPTYDDTELNTLRDKNSPIYVQESGRALIMNISTAASDGKSMLRQLHMKDRELLKFSVGGSTRGDGTVNTSLSSVASNGYDGTEMHMLVHEGCVNLDPVSMAEIIPSYS